MLLRRLYEQVAAELPRLFTFAYFACPSRPKALELLSSALAVAARAPESVVSNPQPAEVLLQMLVEVLEKSFIPEQAQNFELLERLQRRGRFWHPDFQVTESWGRDLILRAELKRKCLLTVLAQLSPTVSLAFILVDIFAYPVHTAAQLMRVSERVLVVRLTRARKRLADHLLTRCGHIDPHNPCYCAGLLWSALEAGFVTPPAVAQSVPLEQPPTQDIGVLYRSLPGAALEADERERLLAVLWTTPAGWALAPTDPN